MTLKTTTSPSDNVSTVYLCDKCSREQYAETEEQPNGLPAADAMTYGWQNKNGRQLCPMCGHAELLS